MTDSRAYDPDRLPWLSDEHTPRRKSNSSALLLSALLAAVLVAGISYWVGMQSVADPDEIYGPASRPEATVRLPEAAVAEPPVAQVRPPPLTEVEPVAEPAPVAIPALEPAPRAKARTTRKPAARTSDRSSSGKTRAQSAPAKRRTAATRPARVQAWPADISAGAYGRVVRIGTFSSRRQAKKGWWAIVRHYPGMKRLKAVVAPVPSLRTGQTLYRLQFGTTSQAHSEILCQRMRIIGQSCVVVGLPGRQGVRR